jgi:sortase (surface protein transpeptidase)
MWSKRRSWGRSTPLLVLATVLAIGGSVALGLGIASSRTFPTPPHNFGSPTSTYRPAPIADRTIPSNPKVVEVPHSTPTEIIIPAIGLKDSIVLLGLNPDGTVEVPSSYQVPGWYQLGPSPGQPGAAVILGHVDSVAGPGAFFNLGALRPGDLVEVRLADGMTARFAVDAIASYLKSAFPDRAVYARPGGSTLQLVTCTGQFDSATRHYLSNLVVYTSLTSLTS